MGNDEIALVFIALAAIMLCCMMAFVLNLRMGG